MKKIFLTAFIVVYCLTAKVFAQQTEKRNVSGFTGIEASSVFNITLVKGDAESLVITADEELMPYIQSEVKNGILKLYIKGEHKNIIKRPDAKLTMKDVNNISLSGSCRLETKDVFEPASFKAELSGTSSLAIRLKTGNMDFDVSGAGKIELEAEAKKAEFDVSGTSKLALKLKAPTMKFDVSGVSNITISGLTDYVFFDASGASKIDALKLIAKKVSVDLSGTNKVTVHATEKLSIDLSGMSSLEYKGNPMIETIDISGMSKVKKID